MNSTAPPPPSAYVVTADVPVAALRVEDAWAGLTGRERRYAHAIASASWAGWPIAALQTSPESWDLLQVLGIAFSGGVDAARAAALSSGVPGACVNA